MTAAFGLSGAPAAAVGDALVLSVLRFLRITILPPDARGDTAAAGADETAASGVGTASATGAVLAKGTAAAASMTTAEAA